MAGAEWTAEETRTLISLWGQSHVQAQLDGVARNRPIYQAIAREHADAGYDRTWQQCRSEIKNLQQRYRKVKDANRVSGNSATTCPFYEEIDAILGTRAASTPATLLESAADGTVVVPSADDLLPGSPQTCLLGADAESDEVDSSATPTPTPTTTSPTTTPTNTSVPTPTSTITTTTTTTTTTNSSAASSTCTTSSATGSAGGQPSSSRNVCRPQSRNTRNMAARLGGAKRGSDTLLLLAEMEERSDERQLKWEKRRKQEADKRREREMQHEERLHSMFMSVFQQMMMGGGWGPVPYPPYPPMQPETSPSQPHAPNGVNNDNPPTTSE